MEQETTKNVFVGNTGNKAEVTEESRPTHTADSLHAKELVRSAAKIHQPLGADYLGSAAVHYYEKKGISESDKTYFVACQTDVSEVNEGHADIGWKQLKSAFLRAFGRQEPKTRS